MRNPKLEAELRENERKLLALVESDWLAGKPMDKFFERDLISLAQDGLKWRNAEPHSGHYVGAATGAFLAAMSEQHGTANSLAMCIAAALDAYDVERRKRL